VSNDETQMKRSNSQELPLYLHQQQMGMSHQRSDLLKAVGEPVVELVAGEHHLRMAVVLVAGEERVRPLKVAGVVLLPLAEDGTYNNYLYIISLNIVLLQPTLCKVHATGCHIRLGNF
jgi:hypothetical protein